MAMNIDEEAIKEIRRILFIVVSFLLV